MSYTRTIRFQYYIIKKVHKEQDGRKKVKVYDGLFDFHNWAKSLGDAKKIRTVIEFNEVKARIEKIAYSKSSAIWGIRILKLRDTNIPSKAKDKVEIKAIELEDGEYIGEDVFMIYDTNTGIAMIQQNRLSLGVSRIEELLQYTYHKYTNPEDESIISIEPIAELERINRLKGKYKQIELSFANLKDYSEDGKTSLSTLLKPFKLLYGATGTIKIGLGRTKDDTLNKTEIEALTSELKDYSNKRFIRSAKIKLQEEEDSDVEIVDLFEENCHEFITFELEERELLEYDYAIRSMRNAYKKRKDELVRYIDLGDRDNGNNRKK